MRGDANTDNSGWSGQWPSRPQAPRLILAVAAFVLALVLSAFPASAAKFHPTPIPAASFGPLGGACPGGSPAIGTGDLSNGTGTGDLSLLATGTGNRALLASGKGNLSKGSKTVTGLVTTTGAFAVGESISGLPGVPPGTTIEAVGGGTLTLSKPAESTGNGRELVSGSKTVTGLVTTTGAFAVGESISGGGIPPSTAIVAVGPGTLTLSNGVESAGAGGALVSGSKTVTNVTASEGSFTVGMAKYSGASAIPSGATIVAVNAGTITLSEGATSAVNGAELKFGSTEIASVATTCGTFAAGQEISGAGLPARTRITAVGANTLTVDRPATASGAGVALEAGSMFSRVARVAFDQEAGKLYLLERTFDESSPGIVHGFDVSTPGIYTPLAGFPISTPADLASPDLAVDNSGGPTQGNVYTSSGPGSSGDNQIHGYDPSGAPLPGFLIPAPPGSSAPVWRALAVDPSGNLWAASHNGVAHEYSSAGDPIGTVDLPGGTPNSLDIDANGDLYVVTASSSALEFWRIAAPSYDNPVKILPSVSTGATIDRATHDLYFSFTKTTDGNIENHVSRYSSDGTLVEEFATNSGLGVPPYTDVAIDQESGAVYVTAEGGGGSKVDVYEALELPGVASGALSDLSATAATLNGSVNPVDLALSGCEFEYVSEEAFQASGFADLSSGGSAPCSPAFGSIPVDSADHPVTAAIAGLSPGVRYRFRISASNLNGTNASRGTSFALTQPGVETVGSPLRSATTARLDSRVDPHGIATDYRFEYIDAAAYQANLAASQAPFAGAVWSATHSAGSGGEIVRASAQLKDLIPDTTYHYRVVADNGAFGGPAIGGERTVTTRASDTPLSHGHFPGPPGSDRAWEQVSLPDTSGNPVSAAMGFSAGGERAVYKVSGGTQGSEAGTLFNFLFAQRPPGAHPEVGWQTRPIFPPRKDTAFSAWLSPTGDEELSTLLGLNIDFVEESAAAVWRLPTGGDAPVKLYDVPPAVYGNAYFFSDDGSRALLLLKGSFDPAHPSPKSKAQLYDVSSGTPKLASLLPGEVVPPCGTPTGSDLFSLPFTLAARPTHWVSADGSRAFFVAGLGCSDPPHLYMRDFVAGETLRVDGPPLEGPDCSGAIIRSTPAAVYFWTQSKLADADTAIGGNCATSPSQFTLGGDVYRYDISGDDFECLTCVVPGGLAANVSTDSFLEGASRTIAVAPEGTRLYFTTRAHLLPGVPEAGTPGIYRVDTATGNLAYVGPIEAGDRVGENPKGVANGEGTAITADGNFLVFRSSSPRLNSFTGSDNGGTPQYYIYDDVGRSLLCASCPPDGSAPRAATSKGIVAGGETAPNMTPLSDGGNFAFATPTPLVAADQNTAPAGENPGRGTDVYEWRDGHLLLVSDGLTDWPGESAPQVASMSRSGRDLFFIQAAQLTPDALDGYPRLYDARIGGGIEFPTIAKPCPLEACQGTPKGAPEELTPGTSSFSGPGNPKAVRCARSKRRVKGRCVARKRQKRGKHQKDQKRKHDKRRAAR